MKLKAGDWVEIRSREEILESLDRNGRRDELPFMPQMFQYCGQRFRVHKRAHKTCDTVNGTGGRRLSNAVHLELRCDGEAYGGCQAHCLIFWKEAWLKPVFGNDRKVHRPSQGESPDDRQRIEHACRMPAVSVGNCTEDDVRLRAQVHDVRDTDGPRYVCQATQLPYYTTALPWWDIQQYLEDYASGNVTPGRMLLGFAYATCQALIKAGIGLGRPIRWLYDGFQSLRGGIPYPRRRGAIPVGQPTPMLALDLQPGELVRVKSYNEILSTLNVENKNRGLYFDAEHVPYCGGVYPVKTLVKKYIDEKTGRMVSLNNVSVILEGVVCQARYSNCRLFCPRGVYPWWREIWLERIPENRQDRQP
jgi:hypothetical protein